MKKDKETYKKYCIGCGICTTCGAEFQKDDSGFFMLSDTALNNKNVIDFCNKVCPVGKMSMENMDTTKIWGRKIKSYLGFSTDTHIRKKASSGGVLTALAIYLLEEKKVDAIIQIGASEKSQIETSLYCSTTREEVINHCGSRYSISSPLKDLFSYIEKDKKCAFIGKPCDVAALRNYLNIKPELKQSIIYLFSFFCAGIPSRKANLNLLNRLNIKEELCTSLNYRGNGWPGQVNAVSKDGESSTLDYAQAWGGILGRDVHPYCRLCIDGIGERADVSCGDGWYIGDDGLPDFSEHEGRNVIYSRNKVGEEILFDAAKKGYISIELFDDDKLLYSIQTYQADRRGTMNAKITALRMFRRCVPQYKKSKLREYSKFVSKKKRIHIFLGTVKRIIKGKM